MKQIPNRQRYFVHKKAGFVAVCDRQFDVEKFSIGGPSDVIWIRLGTKAYDICKTCGTKKLRKVQVSDIHVREAKKVCDELNDGADLKTTIEKFGGSGL